jgi:hypothetical protein
MADRRLAKPTFMHKYGYYECRCKLPTQKGWWAAFWLSRRSSGHRSTAPRRGRSRHSGDIFRLWRHLQHDHLTQLPLGRLRTGPSQQRPCGLDAERDAGRVPPFRRRLESDGYVFYVDGEETNRMEEAVSDTEQFILLSTECDGYRNEERQPSEDLRRAVLPDAFIVDFVRVYDSV